MKFVASFSPWLCGEIRGMEFRLWSAQSQRSLKAELQTYYTQARSEGQKLGLHLPRQLDSPFVADGRAIALSQSLAVQRYGAARRA